MHVYVLNVGIFLDTYTCSRLREDLEAAAFDNQSSSLIKLNNGTILYLREVNKFLALVCILREDNFDRQGKNNNFNIVCLKEMMFFYTTVIITRIIIFVCLSNIQV